MTSIHLAAKQGAEPSLNRCTIGKAPGTSAHAAFVTAVAGRVVDFHEIQR